MAHTVTVLGTQVRGSASGTLKRWSPDPDAYTSIANGVLTAVMDLEIPDALDLSFDMEVSGAKDGIEYIEVLYSDDNVSFTSMWNKNYDPLAGVFAPGNTAKIGYVFGWKHRYLKIKITAHTAGAAGADIKIYATDSIFSSGIMSFSETAVVPGIVYNPILDETQIMNAAVVVSPGNASTAVSVQSGNTSKFDVYLELVLTGWTALATLTITPQVKINGNWRYVSRQSLAGSVVSVHHPMTVSVATGGANFDTVLLLDGLSGTEFRVWVYGDVADGNIAVRAITAKVNM